MRSGLLTSGLVLRNPVTRCELSCPMKISALAHYGQNREMEGGGRGGGGRGGGEGGEGGEGGDARACKI